VTATFLLQRGMLFGSGQPQPNTPSTEIFGNFLAFWVEKLSVSGSPIDPLGLNTGAECDDPVVIFDAVRPGLNVAGRINERTRRDICRACRGLYDFVDASLRTFASNGRTFKALSESARLHAGLL